MRNGATPDWSIVAATLGTSVPADYRAFVECYGAGRIGNFLWVFVPAAPTPAIDLAAQAAMQAEVLDALRASGERIEEQSLPATGGLLSAGMSDNGDVIHWRTRGAPNAWTVVVQEARGPIFVAYDTDLTGFLAGELDGSIRCPAFPDDLPPDWLELEPA
jgi:hypothetical protein